MCKIKICEMKGVFLSTILLDSLIPMEILFSVNILQLLHVFCRKCRSRLEGMYKDKIKGEVSLA